MFFLQQTSSPLFVSSSSYQSACLLLREFLLLVLDPESSNDKRKSQYWRGKDTRVSNILAKHTQHTVEYLILANTSQCWSITVANKPCLLIGKHHVNCDCLYFAHIEIEPLRHYFFWADWRNLSNHQFDCT